MYDGDGDGDGGGDGGPRLNGDRRRDGSGVRGQSYYFRTLHGVRL